MINSVVLVGRLTKDLELRATTSGFTVASGTLAVSKKIKDKEETSFIDFKAFNKAAEILSQYTSKGSQIAISGELKQESWESADGSKKSKLIVIANNFQLLDKKEKVEQVEQEIVEDNGGFTELSDDELPF